MAQTRYDLSKPEGIKESIAELENRKQNIKPPLLTVPNLREVKEGEITPYDDGTDRRLYVKLNNVLYYVNLTAV
jgi:hypothetical protein